MKVTPAHRKAINAEARKRCLGALSHVEVAERHCRSEDHDHGPRLFSHTNLAWLEDLGCDQDLTDLTRLAKLKEIEDHPSGRVAVDLYLYERRPYGDKELVDNLTAEWQDGELVRVYDPLGGVVIKRVKGDGSVWH